MLKAHQGRPGDWWEMSTMEISKEEMKEGNSIPQAKWTQTFTLKELGSTGIF